MAGAGILQDIPKMVALTAAMVKKSNLPVTVKTRLGWDESTKYIVDVAERLQDVGIKAISIHGRTRKQMYKGDADWSLIGKVKANPNMQIPVFGNGDISTPERVIEVKNEFGVDGVMIGRASIGNPWFFNQVKHYLNKGTHLAPPTLAERIEVCRIHLKKSIEWKGERLGVLEMRKHYSRYFKGIPHIKEYRIQLVSLMEVNDIYALLDSMEQESVEIQLF